MANLEISLGGFFLFHKHFFILGLILLDTTLSLFMAVQYVINNTLIWSSRLTPRSAASQPHEKWCLPVSAPWLGLGKCWGAFASATWHGIIGVLTREEPWVYEWGMWWGGRGWHSRARRDTCCCSKVWRSLRGKIGIHTSSFIGSKTVVSEGR